MRRAASVVLAGGLMLTVSPLAAPAQAADRPAAKAPAKPSIKAKAGYLMDLKSGKSLFSKGDSTRREMASTTKIATAITVLKTKGLDLNRKVTVKQTYLDHVFLEGGSSAKLRVHDKVTVRQLLYGLMLPSGCDAAYALADTFGKGATTAARTKSFIGMMNKTATGLKLKNTKFDSFDGISHGKLTNYTTPSDFAKLTQHSLTNKTFREVVKTKTYKTTATTGKGGPSKYVWDNTNQLLDGKGYKYQGAIGIKTGTGSAAGKCLVFAATQGSKTYVGVVLNSTDRYGDARKLLDHGFGKKTAKTMQMRSLPADVLD
ncbi:serine hydrolase [Streptomyces sp. NPDC000594]|uniref:D-alanyl-D-alanine carboxypeptidase family protein n=1 Tax=Streptomyces sp. NPDC000594 TaxID=3154261 RepID=UPI00331BD167